MSLEDFLSSKLEDQGFKYEWNNGILEAETAMKFSEQILVDKIIRKFCQTKSFQEGNSLLPEVECYLKGIQSVKKPDICNAEGVISDFQITVNELFERT